MSQAWHKENVSCIITARISNIANPSSIQDKCCIWIYTTSQWALLTVESLWLSGRASDCEIRRSEVWFLKGTQNFSFVLHSWQVKKNIFFPQYTPGIKIYIQTKRNKFWRGGRIVVYHDRLETLPQAAPAQENFDNVKKLSLHLSTSNSSRVVLWGNFQGVVRSLFLSWERGRVRAFLISLLLWP